MYGAYNWTLELLFQNTFKQFTSYGDTYAAGHPQGEKRAEQDWLDGALDTHPEYYL